MQAVPKLKQFPYMYILEYLDSFVENINNLST